MRGIVCLWLGVSQDVVVSDRGNTLWALGYGFKKTSRAGEQDRPDIAVKRRHWRHWRRWQHWLRPERPVFVDETGAKTNMARLRGRCPRGQRLNATLPWGYWKTATFVAGLRLHGNVAKFGHGKASSSSDHYHRATA